jgi:hypothetical protein
MPKVNTKASCQVVSGGYIEPCSADPDDIFIEDIAHALALTNRWSGNTQYLDDVSAFPGSRDSYPIPGASRGDPFFYSVAQHSCHVHDIVAREMSVESSFYALMHDASEAYLVDIPRPIKPELSNYYEIEARLMAVIIDKFGIPFCPEIKQEVVEIDNNMIFWERDAIVGEPVAPYGNEFQHPGGTIFDHVPNFVSWSPKRAKAEFIMRFKYQNEMPVMMGDGESFQTCIRNFVNDNLGFTSKWAGLAHLDFPKVA